MESSLNCHAVKIDLKQGKQRIRVIVSKWNDWSRTRYRVCIAIVPPLERDIAEKRLSIREIVRETKSNQTMNRRQRGKLRIGLMIYSVKWKRIMGIFDSFPDWNIIRI